MTEVAEAAGPEEPARDLRSLRRLTAKLAGIAGSAVSGATLTSPRLRGRTARATSSLRRWIFWLAWRRVEVGTDVGADAARMDPPPAEVPGSRPSGQGWACAQLMRRAFALDVLACPACGGRLRLIALIVDPHGPRLFWTPRPSPPPWATAPRLPLAPPRWRVRGPECLRGGPQPRAVCPLPPRLCAPEAPGPSELVQVAATVPIDRDVGWAVSGRIRR